MTDTLRIGIISPEKSQERILKIASGVIKPGTDEPKAYFATLDQFGRVLNADSKELIKKLQTAKPGSVSELAKLLNRDQGNVTKTLQKLERIGLVELQRIKKSKKPVLLYSRVEIILYLNEDLAVA